MRVLKVIVAFLPTLLRLLLGVMLMMSGWTWLHRPDPVAYVADAVNLALDGGIRSGSTNRSCERWSYRISPCSPPSWDGVSC